MSETIEPTDAESWLISSGWRRSGSKNEASTLWARGRMELLLPLIPSASDFDRRISEFIREAARASHKTPSVLCEEIRRVSTDVSSWRAEDERINADGIHLIDGIDFISSVKDAFVAAASATIHNRGYFGRGIPQQARDHVGSMRIGHTQPGSYIVPIVSRIYQNSSHDLVDAPLVPSPKITTSRREYGATTVTSGTSSDVPKKITTSGEKKRKRNYSRHALESPEVLQEAAFTVQREPFSRQVMQNLETALRAIVEMADSGASITPREVNGSVGFGVNYELCTAIRQTFSLDIAEALSVDFSWATKLESRSKSTGSIVLTRSSLPAIDKMVEVLRESPVVGMQTVVGTVRGIRDRGLSGGNDVIVRSSYGGANRDIKFRLSNEMRAELGQAWSEDRLIYVTGTLRRQSGRAWVFDTVDRFGFAQELPIESFESAIDTNLH